MCSLKDEITGFDQRAVEAFAEVARYELFVMRASKTSDGAGGWIYGEPAAVNTEPIPCTVSARDRTEKDETDAKLVSITTYKITFPVVINGEAVDVLASDRLKISGTPERTFNIIGLPQAGGFYKAKCEREG